MQLLAHPGHGSALGAGLDASTAAALAILVVIAIAAIVRSISRRTK